MRCGRRTIVVLLLATCATPAALALTAEELGDLDARIEYAYYANDRRDLEALIEEHAALATGKERWAGYQYAHAQFRLARLALDGHDLAGAQLAARRCSGALEAAGSATPDAVEAAILGASCEAYAGHLLGAGTASRLDAAAKTAPGNPRLLLARAYAAYAAAPKTTDAVRLRGQLELARHAALAFDAPTATPPGAPSFGAAEAWLLVGSRAEALGDWLGAREAYERCLVLVPDYALARTRLGSLTARTR